MASIDGLFSMLPDDILYQIFYALTPRQRVKASVVCKSWRDVISSFNDKNLVQTRKICRYCCNPEPCIRCFYCRKFYSIDRVIKLAAADNNTTFTEFYLFRPFYAPYNLSRVILESRLILTVLYLNGCTIENDFDDIKEFFSLKEIYFHSIKISPTKFSKFINKCTSIVELTIKNWSSNGCYPCSISVPSLNQLKKFHVNVDNIDELEIKAPNLQEFSLFSSSSQRVKLDLCACTKLQVLEMDCNYLVKGFSEDISEVLLRVLPCLKSLFLRLRPGLNKIKLLSTQLENLDLRKHG